MPGTSATVRAVIATTPHQLDACWIPRQHKANQEDRVAGGAARWDRAGCRRRSQPRHSEVRHAQFFIASRRAATGSARCESQIASEVRAMGLRGLGRPPPAAASRHSRHPERRTARAGRPRPRGPSRSVWTSLKRRPALSTPCEKTSAAARSNRELRITLTVPRTTPSPASLPPAYPDERRRAEAGSGPRDLLIRFNAQQRGQSSDIELIHHGRRRRDHDAHRRQPWLLGDSLLQRLRWGATAVT